MPNCSLKERKTRRISIPCFQCSRSAIATALSEEDVSDALYELKGMVEEQYGTVIPLPELYVTLDKHFKEWDPATDALTLAADLLNDASFPREHRRSRSDTDGSHDGSTRPSVI
ncbi:MAG: hypothetical protein DMG58_33760 [Acidobacteria bacterium]|nr:MAG: hypothetical protein DMG58_33760 [Acidobacteriota bacterium]